MTKLIRTSLIKSVELRDVDAITDIYNGYVTGGSATFETEPVGTAEIRSRIAGISARFPYLVCGEGKSGRLLLCTRLENKSGLPVYARNDGLPFTRTILAGESASG